MGVFEVTNCDLKVVGWPSLIAFAFTEPGVAMLASVLRSERAVQVNIAIMRTFVRLLICSKIRGGFETRGLLIAVYHVGGPGGACGGSDDGIELVLVHDFVNPLVPRQSVILLERFPVLPAGQRSLGFGLDEDLLSEVRHFPVTILLVVKRR